MEINEERKKKLLEYAENDVIQGIYLQFLGQLYTKKANECETNTKENEEFSKLAISYAAESIRRFEEAEFIKNKLKEKKND